jgi:hypothetical protein
MTGEHDQMVIRSFRVVFALERRLFAIDRFRLPLPHGLPVLAVGYFAALTLLLAVLARLPLIALVVGVIPPPVRWVLLPAVGAALLMRVRPDGRAPHRALLARLRHRAGPRHLDAFRPVPAPGAVATITDPLVFSELRQAPAGRAATVTGPAVLRVRGAVAVDRRRRRADLAVAVGGGWRVLRVPAGWTVRVR